MVVVQYGKHPVQSDAALQEALLRRDAEKFVFQLEKGDGGMIHHQCVIKFAHKVTKNPIIDYLSEALCAGDRTSISAEPCKDKDAAMRYCMKTDHTKIGETVIVGIDNGRLVSTDLVDDYFDLTQQSMWQAFILSHCGVKPPRADREIIWVVDREGGTGKSSLTRHLVLRHRFCMLSTGTKGDIHLQAGPKWAGYVFDLPRAMAVGSGWHGAVEELKNGLIFSNKYESTTKVFNPPWVFILSNAEPVGTAFSRDRLVLVDLDDARAGWLEPYNGGGFVTEYGDGTAHASGEQCPGRPYPRLLRHPNPTVRRVRPAGIRTPLGFTVDSTSALSVDEPAYRSLRVRPVAALQAGVGAADASGAGATPPQHEASSDVRAHVDAE